MSIDLKNVMAYQTWFYQLGKKTGQRLNKGRWLAKSLQGNTDQALEAEYLVGMAMANNIINENAHVDDVNINAIIKETATPLLYRVKRKTRRFTFYVLDSKDINAFALPGGFIFMTIALLNKIGYDRHKMAFVMAHEMVHVLGRHPLKRILADYSVNFIAGLFKSKLVAGQVAKQVVQDLLSKSYSRKNELEADAFAVRLMYSSGYNAHEAPEALKIIDRNNNAGTKTLNYFATHPDLSTRLREMERVINRFSET
ncbi:MAG: M48 family metalloprotease [Caldithrix sp.]|nr:M48 family metalloprotease [Caldithrix sp.]